MSRPDDKPPPVDSQTFRKACAQFATGVAVATVRAEDGAPHGLTVNSFTSVSLQPPLVLICIGHECQILPHFQRAPFFALNILTAEQQELSVLFARRTDNRFEDRPWREGVTGAPLIPGTLASIECRRVNLIDAGDHTIVLGEMVAAAIYTGSPLIYFNQSYRSIW